MLRTELIEGKVLAPTERRGDIFIGIIEDFEHDAAMAHALVMAMAEHRYLDVDSHWDKVRRDIYERADELMREWGYADET